MYLANVVLPLFNVTYVPHFTLLLSSIFSAQVSDSLYDGCGSTKTCIGFPKNCIKKQNCEAFAATFVRDGKYIFEMRSRPESAYIASGLSFDRKMGDDSVMECVRDNGQIKVFSSYTINDGDTYDSIRYGIPQNIIRLVEGRIENGAIYCQIERDVESTVSDIKFDLKKGKFYLLFATGNKVKSDRIQFHNLGHAASDGIIKY